MNKTKKDITYHTTEVEQKLRDFYLDNYNCLWYVMDNKVDKWDSNRVGHYGEIAHNCKRASYYSVDTITKKKHRINNDRIVIDCDKGIAVALDKLKELFDILKCKYWVIAGTDKKDKPKDSGSIVILFHPINGMEYKTKIQTLVRCLNMLAGDVLNTGYQHKNPMWWGVNQFYSVGDNIIDFNTLYRKTLSCCKMSAKGVLEQWKRERKNAFDIKTLEAIENNENAEKILKCFDLSNQSGDLAKKVAPYRKPKEAKELTPIDYAKHLIFWNSYFARESIYKKISLAEKFNLTVQQEKMYYGEARKQVNEYAPTYGVLSMLGFSDTEISEIQTECKRRREEGLTTKNREMKEKVKYQNTRLFFEYNEHKLTNNPNMDKIKSIINDINTDREKNSRGIWWSNDNRFFDVINLAFGIDVLSNEKYTLRFTWTSDSCKNGTHGNGYGGNVGNSTIPTVPKISKSEDQKYQTYYIRTKDNLIVAKDDFIKNYLNGKCHNISYQAKQLGFV